ncbi:DNA repair protein RecO C-terminal domain-containing protein, partial [Streptomyces nigra]
DAMPTSWWTDDPDYVDAFYTLARETTLLGALLTGDWETADACEPRYVREGSGLVSAYLHWHLERGLRSLRYVEK